MKYEDEGLYNIAGYVDEYYNSKEGRTVEETMGLIKTEVLKCFNQHKESLTHEHPLTDKIQERNNKQSIQDRLPEELEKLLAYEPHDPIKPSHYRKGEIDLFESWYRTRPFNEFRAIMESIAERYMKRDKTNRVEDLEKAIYVLTRLKEYEEIENEK